MALFAGIIAPFQENSGSLKHIFVAYSDWTMIRSRSPIPGRNTEKIPDDAQLWPYTARAQQLTFLRSEAG
jgi:hypothetical protein